MLHKPISLTLARGLSDFTDDFSLISQSIIFERLSQINLSKILFGILLFLEIRWLSKIL